MQPERDGLDQDVSSKLGSLVSRSRLARLRNLPGIVGEHTVKVKKGTQDFASGIVGDIKSGTAQEKLSPFPRPLTPELRAPKVTQPSKP